MDSDDIALPHRFESELNVLLDDPTIDIVGGNIAEFIGDEENIVAKRVVPVSDSAIKQYMRKRCPFNHMTVIYKRSAVLNCGNYIDLFWNEDYYLWIRMAEDGCKMANTGDIAVKVRTGKDMYKRRGGRRYFKSEMFLQKYMLKNKMIDSFTFFINLSKRVIIQLLLPSGIRGWVFRKFARKEVW